LSLGDHEEKAVVSTTSAEELGSRAETPCLNDPLDDALAAALLKATEAGNLELVGRIVGELRTRREERAGVPSLERARLARRGT
jgi:hypothetical protein